MILPLPRWILVFPGALAGGDGEEEKAGDERSKEPLQPPK